MPELISLETAKSHLRVEFDDDDALISGLIIAAREYTEKFLNKPLVAKDEEDEEPDVPQTWIQAMLLMIGTWYERRESGSVPDAAEKLLWLDRNVPMA